MFQAEGGGETGVTVPVGGTPRALESNKRLGEGVRPAQLIPRTRAKQVRSNISQVFHVMDFHTKTDFIFHTVHCTL